MHALRRVRLTLPAVVTLALLALPGGASAQRSSSTPETIRNALPDALSSAFRDAAGRTLPAVVFIAVERQADALASLPEAQREFFRGPGADDQPIVGSGSGFVVDADGLVMTNHHVVNGADAIRVRLEDGHEYDADLVASDPNTDVAVIRVRLPHGRTLPVAEIGDSDALRVGDWVLALGNPLGLDFTVTAGIVSAVGRQLNQPGGASLESYIQTDAAINPGNSGGPLIDLRGRVVGINTAISGSRFIGYGFAVPIEMATRAAEDLITVGYVRRPMLGVGIQDVTEVDAEVYGLESIAGAEVIRVEPSSPAARAGIRVGDVVTQLDGHAVRDATALTASLALRQPGDDVELTVFREGRVQQLTASLGQFDVQPRPLPVAHEPAASGWRLGFDVAPLTPMLAREFDRSARDAGVSAPDSGVVIATVDDNSPAARAQLRPGQLILSVNGHPVASVADVQAIAGDVHAGSALSLRLLDPDIGETIVNYRVR